MNRMLNTTILLLSSEPVVRSVIQEALERQGYSVLAAGDLGIAIDYLEKCTSDLLIIRSYVEGIPGYDAAIFLRNKCRGLRVLIVGGLIDDDRLKYRMTVEAFEVFPKPFTATVLLDKVKDALHKVH